MSAVCNSVRSSSRSYSKLLSIAGLAAALFVALAVPASAQSGSAVLTARDQGNGEILLEWTAQANVVSYRVERTAPGIPTVSLEAGGRLSVMDFAGIAPTYSYRLLARAAAREEQEIATLSYDAPGYVLARVAHAAGLPPQLRSALGTNLHPIKYWSPQVPFVDVMESSSAWISGDSVNWDNHNPINLDAIGWVRSLAPGQVARTLLLWDIGDHYPAGQYLVRYKGEGTMKFTFPGSVVSQKPGEMLLQVTPGSGGIYLRIEATNPANYLRDIEIIMPGGICEGDSFKHVASAMECGGGFLSFADYSRSIVFYPVFLERLRNFSVLRFMEWYGRNLVDCGDVTFSAIRLSCFACCVSAVR